jgi:HK97 family phage portal protein
VRWPWQRSNVLEGAVKAIAEERGFANFAAWQNQVPAWPGRWFTVAGPQVTLTSAAGLPTVAACIRLFAEMTGGTPLEVWKGAGPDATKAEDTWQWFRIHDRPNDEQAAYEFWRDAETSLSSVGNAFIWKAKARPIPLDEEDIQFKLIDPTVVTIKREDGRKKFKIGSREEWYDSRTILHIRGWTLNPQDDFGLSPIGLHRESLGGALAMEEFAQSFYANGATLSGVIEIPDAISRETAAELRDDFADRHVGIGNAYKPAVLYNGAKYNPLGINPNDAQYIQSRDWTIPDIARMFRISAVGLVGATLGQQQTSAADDLERFVKFDLPARLWEIEGALSTDPDLFGTGSDLHPKFDPDAILQADLKTRYEAYRLGAQGGWLLADDIRAKEKLPPLPDGVGKIPQITPVGGAPNPPPLDGSQNGQSEPARGLTGKVREVIKEVHHALAPE